MSDGTVVVGAGLTAATAVETLRAHGYAEPITLIGEEDELPYERPALSKDYLIGKTGKADVHDAGWYGERDVDVRTGVRATAVDRAARSVTLADGDTVRYEHLLVATGASPRRLPVPGADLPGVRTLRTRADSDALREALARDERWVVVGGGWIGLEVAAAARGAGHLVTVLEYAPLPLHRVLGDRLARHFLDLHLRNGVDVRTGTGLDSVRETASGLSVRAGGDEIEADVVVMAVGVAPNTELLAELATRDGIPVDEHLRTADPHVLAAGDVAYATNTTLGRALRVEHWDNAIKQGRLAAGTILGLSDGYDWLPYFFTDQYDLGMEYVGHHDPDDRVVLRGNPAGGEFVAFWQDGERVTAAMNVNVWDVNPSLRALVGREVPADRLADRDVPLDEL